MPIVSCIWSNPQFVEFFKSSPRRAFEYRKSCGLGEIPEEYLTEEEKSALKAVETVETALMTNDTIENEETQAEEINVTREELKDLLKNAGIEFKGNSKTDVLVNLCIENNLI